MTFEYRFVTVTFDDVAVRFEVGYPVYACFTRPDEVHHAINAALN
jgi:hypothetical protein